MIVNLLPDFLAVLNSTDRVAAYNQYFEAHRHRLAAYWHNYVLDPDGPHFQDVVRMAALADREDMRAMLERVDVVSLARDTEAREKDHRKEGRKEDRTEDCKEDREEEARRGKAGVIRTCFLS